MNEDSQKVNTLKINMQNILEIFHKYKKQIYILMLFVLFAITYYVFFHIPTVRLSVPDTGNFRQVEI